MPLNHYLAVRKRGACNWSGALSTARAARRVGNANQAVAFKPTALGGLVRGATSDQQTLNIYISDCIASNSSADGDHSQRFRLTFESEREGKHFSVQGAARGIALQIKDEQGKLISPGMLLEHSTPSADMLMLNYSLTLVGSGHALEAGGYHATIKLSIQHF
ncbi:fimbrial protein [Pseudomonas sp. UM16]|uniref:fimbrial protein n=1 Tax=Pseudomonas sp. UM16 TaxID=3158962 RepID=UPI00399018F6